MPFREALPSGGYLLNRNFLDDDDERARQLDRDLAVTFGTGRFRTWDEHRAYFEGLELVDPGLVYANDWRPDGHTKVESPCHGFLSAGIGRKP